MAIENINVEKLLGTVKKSLKEDIAKPK